MNGLAGDPTGAEVQDNEDLLHQEGRAVGHFEDGGGLLIGVLGILEQLTGYLGPGTVGGCFFLLGWHGKPPLGGLRAGYGDGLAILNYTTQFSTKNAPAQNFCWAVPQISQRCFRHPERGPGCRFIIAGMGASAGGHRSSSPRRVAIGISIAIETEIRRAKLMPTAHRHLPNNEQPLPARVTFDPDSDPHSHLDGAWDERHRSL